jgi:dTMP kinase
MSGLLVSVEGISGTGKTTLTAPFAACLRDRGIPVVSLDGFSQRATSAQRDLGHDILRALIHAAGGDPFLRTGHPATETLLLLAIKAHDYEKHCRPALQQGHLVIEGRSLHTTAVYQSLILHPHDNQQALARAHQILDLATCWRPLPDLTLLITDDVAASLRRLEHRDHTRCTAEQRHLHQRADWLFRQLVSATPTTIRLIDRRYLSREDAVAQMLAAAETLPGVDQLLSPERFT